MDRSAGTCHYKRTYGSERAGSRYPEQSRRTGEGSAVCDWVSVTDTCREGDRDSARGRRQVEDLLYVIGYPYDNDDEMEA
eukprot:7905994-Pyramimonas_sp.AAC.3